MYVCVLGCSLNSWMCVLVFVFIPWSLIFRFHLILWLGNCQYECRNRFFCVVVVAFMPLLHRFVAFPPFVFFFFFAFVFYLFHFHDSIVNVSVIVRCMCVNVCVLYVLLFSIWFYLPSLLLLLLAAISSNSCFSYPLSFIIIAIIVSVDWLVGIAATATAATTATTSH